MLIGYAEWERENLTARVLLAGKMAHSSKQSKRVQLRSLLPRSTVIKRAELGMSDVAEAVASPPELLLLLLLLLLLAEAPESPKLAMLTPSAADQTARCRSALCRP